MPLRLEIKRKLAQRSDRVKCVDLHPTEPWILATLYTGSVYIWNHVTQTLVKSFEVTELPVRSAKFIARKQWLVAGSDDMFLRVYNYNTMDKVKAFEAHTDYIRCVAVHPSLPYVLSSSDDMLIKLWDWDKGWACTQIFEGHSHYVMQVVFNPKDTNTFASASLDRTIKIWGLGSPDANFTLEGHQKGVNCLDYFTGGDKPYLLSGSDDQLIRVWDYQTKSCVQTLEGHTHNVSSVCFHPELPIIISGSEDGTVRIWHATTYRLENTLNYGLERVWCVAYLKGSNRIAIGYDEGTIMIKIGREEPVASMDSSGKIIWARHNEIQTVNVRSVPAGFQPTDGERLPLAVKDLGSCDLYPQSLRHNPNGRFVAVCGDGEYIVYTALAWRNKSFGGALELAWSSEGEYAVRESTSKIRIFSKSFQERKAIRPSFSAEGLHGGALLAVRSQEFVCFYDWAECRVVRRIDVAVRQLYWSDSGDLVALASDSSFYILKFNREAVAAYLEGGAGGAEGGEEEGLEEAFELLYEVSERVRTGLWVGDCFVYNNSAWRLNYCVGGEVTTMFHLDRPMYLLGYMAQQSRLYLMDKEFNVISYTLLLSLIEFKTLVLRGDMEEAERVLPTIPQDQLNSVAKFLEAQGQTEDALRVATDPDYKFELAVQLGDLEIAQEIAEIAQSESKWKQLGDLALSAGKLALAEQSFFQAWDLSGLLLLFCSQGNGEGMQKLAEAAQQRGKYNVAFVALFLLGRTDDCVNLLCNSGRIPEAAFLARTYTPSRVSEVVALWKADLKKINQKAAESLADPAEYPNLFSNWLLALKAEETVKAETAVYPATEYPNFAGSNTINVIENLQQLALQEAEEEAPAEEYAEAEDGVEVEAEEEDEVEAEEEDEEEAEAEVEVGAEVAAGAEEREEVDEDWGEEEE